MFRKASEYQAVGDASTRYLWYPSTTSNIARLLPDAKIIAILRQPAETAFSQCMMRVRDG